MAKNSSQSNSSDRLPKSLAVGYEVPDENTIGIFAVGILALVIGFGIFMGCWWLFNHFRKEVSLEETFDPVSLPTPRLQLNPQLDLQEMLKRDQKRLSSFGWVSNNEHRNSSGRENRARVDWVHIPINDAMDLIVQEYKRKGAHKQ